MACLASAIVLSGISQESHLARSMPNDLRCSESIINKRLIYQALTDRELPQTA
jgi:hypothetical protein